MSAASLGTSPPGRRLGRFLVLSLIAHLALLWAWRAPAGLVLPAASERSVLQVRLRAGGTPPRHGSASRVRKAVAASRPVQRKSPSKPTDPVTARTPVGRPATPGQPHPAPGSKARTSPSPAAGTPDVGSAGNRKGRTGSGHAVPGNARRPIPARRFDAAAARSRVLTQVRQDLARYFHYPGMARRRGWQGRVVLDFAVRPDGRISDVRVAQSSGHQVLDRSAVRTLRRIGRLRIRGGWPPGGLHDVRLPVVYRLEG